MKLVAPVLVLVLGFALTGCGEGEPEATPTKTVTATATVTVTATPETGDATDAPTEAPADDDPSTEAFGGTISFENGLTVSISRPKRFAPSSEASYDGSPLPKGIPVMFTITLTNEGTAPLSRELEFVNVSSAGRETQEVGLDDPQYNLQALPVDTRLPAGAKSVYEMGYVVGDPRDVSVEYTGNDLEPVTFTSSP